MLSPREPSRSLLPLTSRRAPPPSGGLEPFWAQRTCLAWLAWHPRVALGAFPNGRRACRTSLQGGAGLVRWHWRRWCARLAGLARTCRAAKGMMRPALALGPGVALDNRAYARERTGPKGALAQGAPRSPATARDPRSPTLIAPMTDHALAGPWAAMPLTRHACQSSQALSPRPARRGLQC